jgi:hypothetical protein
MNGTAVVTASNVAGNNTLAEFTNQWLGDAPGQSFNFTGEVMLGRTQATTPSSDVMYLKDMTLANGATTPPSPNYDANLHTSFDLRVGFVQSGSAYITARGGDNHDVDLFGENRGTNGVYIHLGGGNTGAATAGGSGNPWNLSVNGGGYVFGPSSQAEFLLVPNIVTRTLINSGSLPDNNGAAYDSPLELSAKLAPDDIIFPGFVSLQVKAGNNVYKFTFDPNDPAFAGTFDWQHATPIIFVGKGAFDSNNPANAHLGVLAPGDANADGVTSFNDLVAVAQHYGSSDQPWANGDFTGDGMVDFNDLVVLAQNYNQPVTAPGAGSAQAGVPEPGGLMVAAMLGGAWLAWRRRAARGVTVLWLVLGLGASGTWAQAAPVPAFGFGGATSEQFNGGFTSVGYEFSTSAPLLIPALGIFDHAGTDISAAGWDVGIYTTDASHTLLTSTTVRSSDTTTSPAGGTDVFRYRNLTTPFILPAGTYMLASMDPSGWFDKNATGLTTGTGLGTITINHATFTGLGTGGQPLAFPGNVFDTNLPGNFGPNFLAEAVPEPSSMGVVLGCVVGLMARRRG